MFNLTYLYQFLFDYIYDVRSLPEVISAFQKIAHRCYVTFGTHTLEPNSDGQRGAKNLPFRADFFRATASKWGQLVES